MIVRPMRPADVEALSDIAVAAYRSGFAAILEPEALAPFDHAFFALRFVAQVSQVTVAEAGRPLGFAKTTFGADGRGHLDMLFVWPDAQGTGAGSALLAEAEARGVTSLECFRDNLPARRFYEARGWRPAHAYDREFAGRERAFVCYEKARPGA